MSENRESIGGLLGLLSVGMAVCCGLPLLLGAGIAVGAAGLAIGSGLVVAAGVGAAGWGWRRRHNADHCEHSAEEVASVSRRDDSMRTH